MRGRMPWSPAPRGVTALTALLAVLLLLPTRAAASWQSLQRLSQALQALEDMVTEQRPCETCCAGPRRALTLDGLRADLRGLLRQGVASKHLLRTVVWELYTANTSPHLMSSFHKFHEDMRSTSWPQPQPNPHRSQRHFAHSKAPGGLLGDSRLPPGSGSVHSGPLPLEGVARGLQRAPVEGARLAGDCRNAVTDLRALETRVASKAQTRSPAPTDTGDGVRSRTDEALEQRQISGPQTSPDRLSRPAGVPRQVFRPGDLSQGLDRPSDPSQGSLRPGDLSQGLFRPSDPSQGGFSHSDLNQGSLRPGDPSQGSFRPGGPSQGSFKPVDPNYGSLRPGDPSKGSLRPGDPSYDSLRPGDPIKGSLRPGDPSYDSLRPGDTSQGSLRPGDPSYGSLRPGDPSKGNLRPDNPSYGSLRPDDPSYGSLRPGDTNQGSLRPSYPNQGSYRPSHASQGSLRPGHLRKSHGLGRLKLGVPRPPSVSLTKQTSTLSESPLQDRKIPLPPDPGRQRGGERTPGLTRPPPACSNQSVTSSGAGCDVTVAKNSDLSARGRKPEDAGEAVWPGRLPDKPTGLQVIITDPEVRGRGQRSFRQEVTLTPSSGVFEVLRQASVAYETRGGGDLRENPFRFRLGRFQSTCYILQTALGRSITADRYWNIRVQDSNDKVLFGDICIPNKHHLPMKPGYTIFLTYRPLPISRRTK